MYKNNSRFSSKFEGCSPLQLLYNLAGMKPANGYYSYTNRYLRVSSFQVDINSCCQHGFVLRHIRLPNFGFGIARRWRNHQERNFKGNFKF